MRISWLGKKGTWREVADSARTTIAKEAGVGDPPSSWKRRMLLAEHSPIRQLQYKWKWYDLPYWVSVHLVRHWLGIVHWVRTQREDRTGVKRSSLNQTASVEHEAEATAQALINISRKRLCSMASKETTEAWKLVREAIRKEEPELADVMVKECVYRGFCPEYISCGHYKGNLYKAEIAAYRKGINN